MPQSDPDAARPDADHTPFDAEPADAAPAPCNLQAPFGTPVVVGGLDGFSEVEAGGLSRDELTVVVAGTQGSAWDLWMATRPDRTAAFSGVHLLPSTPYFEYVPEISPDGLSMYFHADVDGESPPSDVFVAQRSDQVSDFGAPSPVSGLSDPTKAEAMPWPTTTGIYYACGDATTLHICHAARMGAGYGPSQVLGELEGGGLEVDPVVSADELTIYFDSTRSDGAGAMDIWVARRTAVTQPFGAPVNVTELNTPGNEIPTFLSTDGCRLYFDAGAGSAGHLAVASKP